METSHLSVLSSPQFPFKELYYWFKENKRDLPWRGSVTPYQVWISEIMLQQTQVNTVIPFYRRWMKSFPTLKSLNNFEDYSKREQEVIYLWQGLGYYRRVINILKTAIILQRDFKGRFPRQIKDILTLPGIGDYTAGAISNFAFGKKQAMVDSNFERVLTRFFYLTPQNQQKNPKKIFWQIARQLIEHPQNQQTIVFNEAIMEIGALICRSNPQCDICPLSGYCIAYRKGNPSHQPFKKNQNIKLVKSSAFIIEKNNRILMIKENQLHQTKISKIKNKEKSRKREIENKGKNKSLLLHSLWRFPILDRHSCGNNNKKGLEKLFNQSIFSKLVINYDSENSFTTFKIGRKLLMFDHFYTQYKINLQVFSATIENLKIKKRKKIIFSDKEIEVNWFCLEEIEKLGLSLADQKIRNWLKSHHDKIKR